MKQVNKTSDEAMNMEVSNLKQITLINGLVYLCSELFLQQIFMV